MLFLQIRQAEVSLDDGRLDEAYELLQSPRLRAHRRGQALISELVTRLVKRARAHLTGGRPTFAMTDCNKARAIGGNLDEVISLQQEIEQQVVEADRARRAGAQATAMQNAARMVDSAMGRKDTDQAIQELLRARGNGCMDSQLREHDAVLRTQLQAQVNDVIGQGRLHQLNRLLSRLGRLDPEGLATQELTSAADQIGAAQEQMTHGDFRAAALILQRLSVQFPQASWIRETTTRLVEAANAVELVRTGPLGLITMSSGKLPPSDPPRNAPSAPAMPGASSSRRMVLQVDGAGSFLVVPSNSIRVGPISSSPSPDIGLLAEAGAMSYTIDRVEDDYFISSAGSSRRLLSDGDRISISPRCSLIFRLPSQASTSAVLDLVSGRFPRADVRRAILLDRDLIIGSSTSAHVRVEGMTEQLVLQMRNGQLFCRNEQLALGKPATISGVSLAMIMA